MTGKRSDAPLRRLVPIPGLPEPYRWLPIVESQARAMMVVNEGSLEEDGDAGGHGRYLVKLTAKGRGGRGVFPAQFSTDVSWGPGRTDLEDTFEMGGFNCVTVVRRRG